MFISINGTLGSGKSTVCNILKNNHGFEIYTAGSALREYAAKLGISLLELNERLAKNHVINGESIDDFVDKATVEHARKNADKKVVFDSRLAWHFVPQSFKVYLTVEPEIAAERTIDTRKLAEENYGTKQEAYAALVKRKELEDVRYKKIYNVDGLNLSNYNLVIDTSAIDPDEVVAQILAAAKNKV